jgi:hypothetical protein
MGVSSGMDAMTKSQQVTNLIYRLFLSSWLFAVLWVKGYVWCIFAITALLIPADRFVSLQLDAARANRSQAAKPRSRPGGKRPTSADTVGESSWREPKPQWSAPTAKG